MEKWRDSSLRVRQLLLRGKDKRAAVLGAGVTGRALVRFLVKLEIHVALLDEREISAEVRREFESYADAVEFYPHFSWTAEKIPQQLAFAVVSPGIPVDGAFVSGLAERSVPRVSEVDIGVAVLGMPLVAVTGTNGKTTTTSIISAMLCASGLEAQPAGNIGRPFVDLIDPETVDQDPAERFASLVAEVSSYQLESAIDFAPHVAVWLNLAENHLERHGGMAEYAQAKGRIFAGQSGEDFAVLYTDDPHFGKMRTFVRGKLVPFGLWSGKAERGSYFAPERNELIYISPSGEERYPLSGCKLTGRHNKLNFAAALAAARLAGADPDACQRVIDTFVSLEHRLEFVNERNGVLWVNDSKATTVAATIAAVDALYDDYPKRRVVLLLGGQAKYGSWEPLCPSIDRSCREVICFGADGKKIDEAIEGAAARKGWRSSVCRGVVEAIETATEQSLPGDIVLFSPGCASFDAYSNYEERGRHFKKVVGEL